MTPVSSPEGIVGDDDISAVGTVLKFSGRDIELEDTHRDGQYGTSNSYWTHSVGSRPTNILLRPSQ